MQHVVVGDGDIVGDGEAGVGGVDVGGAGVGGGVCISVVFSLHLIFDLSNFPFPFVIVMLRIKTQGGSSIS